MLHKTLLASNTAAWHGTCDTMENCCRKKKKKAHWISLLDHKGGHQHVKNTVCRNERWPHTALLVLRHNVSICIDLGLPHTQAHWPRWIKGGEQQRLAQSCDSPCQHPGPLPTALPTLRVHHKRCSMCSMCFCENSHFLRAVFWWG